MMVIGVYQVQENIFRAGRSYHRGQLVEFQDPPADDCFRKLCDMSVNRSGRRWEGVPIEDVADLKALIGRDRVPAELRLMVQDRLRRAIRREVDGRELEDRDLQIVETRKGQRTDG